MQQASPGEPSGPDAPIDAALRTQVIETALKRLVAEYVFPDVARKMEAAIRARMQKREYDGIQSSAALARALTQHLREVSKDKHIEVAYSAAPVPPERDPGKPLDAAARERLAKEGRYTNYGFDRVERLQGNIGYLEMRGFFDVDLGGATASAAMTFLADTDALIIDLRRNGGGEPAMIALVTSYLFDGEPVHLNDLYFRRGDRTQQFWTHSFVPGKRYGKRKPVYVLTSSETFSAAEELSYNLKNLKRATLIGETTGGGAHPGDEVRLAEHFWMFIPNGKAISPITKTNWEGVGVKPDIEVPADQALLTAQIAAMKQQVETIDDPELKERLRKTTSDLQTKLDQMKKNARR
jgi:retinol-binding protein 3